MKKTTEELIIELDNRYGNPYGPAETKLIVEAIEHLRELLEFKKAHEK